MNPNVYVDRRILARVDAWITRQHANGLYRPTAVALIESSRGAVLLLKSVKDSWWSFPQGDVRLGEGVIDALLRNVEEKTGISGSQLIVSRFMRATRILMPGMGLRGPVPGTSYYYFDVSVVGVPKVTLQVDVATDYRWLSALEAAEFLCNQGRSRVDETNGLLRALGTEVSIPEEQ